MENIDKCANNGRQNLKAKLSNKPIQAITITEGNFNH